MGSGLARIVVVLVRPAGALNVGSVARLVENFGVGELRLVAPTADLESRECRMLAGRAQPLLLAAPRFDTLEAALEGVGLVVGTSSKLRDARDGAPLTVPLATQLMPREGTAPLALVFGNEADGLTLEEGAACHRVVRIHAPGAHDSFNLSHAVAIVLSMFAHVDTDAEPEGAQPKLADSAQLVTTWMSLLARRGYFRSTAPSHFEPRLRAIVDRMQLGVNDAQLLEGMLRVLASPKMRDVEDSTSSEPA